VKPFYSELHQTLIFIRFHRTFVCIEATYRNMFV